MFWTPLTELWSPYLRIFVKMTDWTPRQQSKGQWWVPITEPQAAMLLTLSAHCLLPKQPRPETNMIGHRSPFCEQFLTEGVFTKEPTCFNHPVAHPATYLSNCLCKVKWGSLCGTEAKGQWVLLSSSCSTPDIVVCSILPRTFLSPHGSLSFSRYLFRYDGSMMPGVFVKNLHAISVLNTAHSLV